MISARFLSHTFLEGNRNLFVIFVAIPCGDYFLQTERGNKERVKQLMNLFLSMEYLRDKKEQIEINFTSRCDVILILMTDDNLVRSHDVCSSTINTSFLALRLDYPQLRF